MPHGLPALLFHCNLYIKKVTSDKIIKKFLTFLFFKKEKKRIKLIFFFFFLLFFLGRTWRTQKLLTRQSLLPSKIQNTFNKPKILTLLHPNLQTQLESLILITNPNLQSFHIHILITGFVGILMAVGILILDPSIIKYVMQLPPPSLGRVFGKLKFLKGWLFLCRQQLMVRF